MINFRSKKNDFYFTLDQIVESIKLFLFVMVAPVLMSKDNAANVISINSGAFLIQLILSSYLTQYLMVRYDRQASYSWIIFFFKITIPVSFALCIFSGYLLAGMFVSLMVGEYFKRLVYYNEQSMMSLLINVTTSGFFFVGIYLIDVVTAKGYIILYFVCSIIYVLLLLCLFNNNPTVLGCKYKTIPIDKELVLFGNKIVTSLVLFWGISQGVYYFSEEIGLNSGDVILMRVTQSVFGLSAMLAGIMETIFLKRMKEISIVYNYNKRVCQYGLISLVVCIANIFVIMMLSFYFDYIHISTFTVFLFFFQYLFMLNRIPSAYFKKKEKIMLITFSYLIGASVGVSVFCSLKFILQYEDMLVSSTCAMFFSNAISCVIMYYFLYKDIRTCITI